MCSGVGRQLKAAALFFLVAAILFTAFAGATAGKAEARASLRAMTTTGPNNWAFQGFNVTGTAGKFVVDQLGWNATKTLGNVGIGNGGIRALNNTSNMEDINYTQNNYMAGDVTTAPWDPSRITAPEETEATNATEKTVNNSTSDKNIGGNNNKNPDLKRIGRENNTSEQEPGNAGQARSGNDIGNIPLNDPYHSILFGRPIGDLMYEHPHAIQSNMYSRLLGLRMPDGSYANIGMRAIGYGY